MAKKNAGRANVGPVTVYRHKAKRKNNPPAGLAAQGKIAEAPKLSFVYNPHLPPVLRFDSDAKPDKLPELLRNARKRPITDKEARLLAEALGNQEPWLEWAGKQEKKGFEVEPVALHIHERVSTQAILKVASRNDVQRDLFADPQLEYQKAVQFYQHDVDWSNRMILGDSLQVMASLARREDLAGKIQMMFFDPPYGINFRSNFQSEIGKLDVKDKEADLTREPEVVKAYRDTWTLGVHSYLAYIRDRLLLCRELLADTGSIFVQISDENLHRIRNLLDEVFRRDNFIVQFTFTKKGSQSGEFVPPINEYILWYTRDRERALEKFRQLYRERDPETDESFPYCELRSGEVITYEEAVDRKLEPKDYRRFSSNALFSQKPGPNEPVMLRGKPYPSGGSSWKIATARVPVVEQSGRALFTENRVRFKRYADDFPATAISNVWTGLAGAPDKVYVVQTNAKVIERCLLMTTDPGDLVLDPTCGSGTTAHVAEQWGRRWITIDTSRVALALARQRLMTATFDFYELKDAERGPIGGFKYQTVPHVTLKSIAQNAGLNLIFAKHQPIVVKTLDTLNSQLKKVSADLRNKLKMKLAGKERQSGKKSITEADRRRWLLPQYEWKEWEVPFDTDDDWPSTLKKALEEYRAVWRAKMDEVNACIAANAETEELIDRPEVDSSIVRVSGPFTMEAVMPAEASLDESTPIGGEPDELETYGGATSEPVNAEAYLDKMLRLLKADGVQFPNNKVMQFTKLEPTPATGDFLHAEGEWQAEDGKVRQVAVSVGPQFGPVTSVQVEDCLRIAHRRGYDDLVFAGFSFDGAAQATIQDDPNPKVRCHLAHIRPDVNMGDLLKEVPNSQLFTVFGSPRTELKQIKDDEFVVEMEGVDIYNPVENTILPTGADKVAAWFVDSDYDGRTFCITQAFFPDKSAWQRLSKALKGVIDEDRFEALTGTTSLSFPAGKYKRAAVKVIDPRGNEVMRVHRLDGKNSGRTEAKRH